MKELGNIYLSWREGLGKRRHIVGVIRNNANEGVRFQYLPEAVEEAKKNGFTSYTEFPDMGKTYTENVLDVFGQRIMKSERSDIQEFLDFWEIDRRFKDDKYYLLAHTQGLNPTDNFEFLADYHPVKSLRFLTDLAGLSVTNLPIGSLKIGDQLQYELDPENPFDEYAVRVFKGDLEVGYIKKVHCKVFYKKHQRLDLKVKALEQNGKIKRVFIKVSS